MKFRKPVKGRQKEKKERGSIVSIRQNSITGKYTVSWLTSGGRVAQYGLKDFR